MPAQIKDAVANIPYERRRDGALVCNSNRELADVLSGNLSADLDTAVMMRYN